MADTLFWENDRVMLLDQTKLPVEQVYLACEDYRAVAAAIQGMVVRGAPAIGVAAAMGIALGALRIKAGGYPDFRRQFEEICGDFAKTRPTAVNLFWAIDHMKRLVDAHGDSSVESLQGLLKEEAIRMAGEDISINRRIGAMGRELISNGDTVMTHCNAGALATAGYGTALGVIRAAHEEGKKIAVFACETRPYLQGARLTAWELKESGIPVTVITDSMAGHAMRTKSIALVITGADCVCANGDVANKIGTYSLAILAREHGIPFYVAAPLSTINMRRKTGADVSIEERSPREITHFGEKRIVPEGVNVWNPAFDITPAKYLSGLVTEKGIIRKPYKRNLTRLAGARQ
jgi:methylthioribose-1-phosphate isomerase